MRSKRLVFSLLWFLVCGSACLAQQYPFVYYTPKDGLVNSRVRKVWQDSKGLMYFFTHGGLSIYDGTRFKNYTVQNGLANDIVNDVLEITPDSLLVATNTAQLNTLVKGKIGLYKTADGFCPVINHFFKSNEGDGYVAADEGLFKMEKNKFTRIPVVDKNGVDIGKNFDQVVEWKNFLLLITWFTEQKEQLILYDKEKKQARDVYSSERVLSAIVYGGDQIWVTTLNGIRSIDMKMLEQGIIKMLPMTAEFENIAGWKNAYAFTEKQGTTWICSSTQVVKLSPGKKELFLSAEQGLRTGNLIDIFVDREGIIWMASDGKGIVKMTGANIELINSLSSGQVSAITALDQQNDTTWLFNANDYSIYRMTKKKLTAFPLAKEIKVTTIYIQNQSLYFSNGKAVFCIGNKDLAASYMKPVKIFMDSLSLPEIGNGVVDGNGFIIQPIKQLRSSYFLYTLNKMKMNKAYEIPYMADQLVLDKKNRLWVATRNNHLMIFSLHPEHPEQYLQLVKDYDELIKDISPRSIAIDNKGDVWIGTRYSGVYRLQFNDLDLRSFEQFSIANGLTDNFVYSLYCDKYNNTWVGTQTGLDKINFRNGRLIIENITRDKNIFQSIYKIIPTGDNYILAQAPDGNLIKCSITSPVITAMPPSVLLTSLVINDQEYPVPVNKFSYRENNFSFSVAAPSFIDERSIRYSYLLKGSNKNTWSEPSSTATFNFINLAPGSYELNVKADFPLASYASQTLTYPFSIAPPYWQTWWFRSLTVLMVVGLLYYTIRAYYRRVIERKQMQFEKERALEKERSRIATDMHDDLGAGLSKIRFLSETVQRNITEEIHQPHLQNIANSSVELVDKFNEIIWAMNEKNNSLDDLLYYIRNYTAKYCAENDLNYTITIPDYVPVVMISGEARRHIFLTVKESLHNIIKHAEAKNIWVTIELDPVILISIKDDGKGFEAGERSKTGTGLRSMEQRMKNMNGKLIIESNKGTLLKMLIPFPSS